jgi:hypothetical protein
MGHTPSCTFKQTLECVVKDTKQLSHSILIYPTNMDDREWHLGDAQEQIEHSYSKEPLYRRSAFALVSVFTCFLGRTDTLCRGDGSRMANLSSIWIVGKHWNIVGFVPSLHTCRLWDVETLSWCSTIQVSQLLISRVSLPVRCE